MPQKPLKKNLSAIKRARQAEKRRVKNQAIESAIKTYTKKFLEAIENQDKGKIEAAYLIVIQALNKASSSGILKKNNASRRISSLSKKLHAVTSGRAA